MGAGLPGDMPWGQGERLRSRLDHGPTSLDPTQPQWRAARVAMKAVARLALLSALAFAQGHAWTVRGRRLRQGARVARRHEALLFARTSAKQRLSAQAPQSVWHRLPLPGPPQDRFRADRALQEGPEAGADGRTLVASRDWGLGPCGRGERALALVLDDLGLLC